MKCPECCSEFRCYVEEGLPWCWCMDEKSKKLTGDKCLCARCLSAKEDKPAGKE